MHKDSPKSYSSGTSTTPLLGLTIGDLFDQIVDQFPDQEALIVRHQKRRYTYRQFQVVVNECARGLLKLGIQKGDRVGIWSQNNAEWATLQYATAKIGAILVNINPSYRLHELEYALKQSGCRVLVFAPHFKTSNYTQMVCELIPELHASEPGKLDVSTFPHLKILISLEPEPVTGLLCWSDLATLAQAISPEELASRQGQLEFDDPINIQYTSGTTGFPK
ncbi:MAG TPA: AMP-binding protein, partial [Acidobacteriota bacterium]|nr:AMP-binding protein [Acidobacteriota bacterium]